MKNISRKLALTFALASLIGCANSAEKNVQSKMDAEAKSSIGLSPAGRGLQVIQNSTALTQIQKDKLLKLHGKTRAQSSKLRQEMSMVKGAFFKTLTSMGPRDKELRILKKKMTKISNKRLKIMFSALDEAKEIMGDLKEEELYDVFMEPGHERVIR